MARDEANVVQQVGEGYNGVIQYAHSAAVDAGEVIAVTGVGACIALAAYDANATGAYAKVGIFKLPITSGVSITQGQEVYWDVSANKVQALASIDQSADVYLGQAVKAGTAAGGYVEVDINARKNGLDSISIEHLDSGIAPSNVMIVVAAGAHTTAGGDTSETITNAAILSTDFIMAHLISIGASNAVISKAAAADGSIAVTMGADPSTDHVIAYAAMRTMA